MKRFAIIIGCAAIAITAVAVKFAPRVGNEPTKAAAEQLPLPQDYSSSPVVGGIPAAETRDQLKSLSPAQAQRREVQVSNRPPAQAPQTYVGPDGKEHAIAYNQGLNLDSRGVQQMKAEIITDMRAHPEVFVGLYGLERSDVDAIVAGKKDLPKDMLANLVM